MPCDLPALLEVAERRGLPLVEDAACALGSEIRTGELGTDRQAARRRRLLLLPSQEDRDHGRRRHATRRGMPSSTVASGSSASTVRACPPPCGIDRRWSSRRSTSSSASTTGSRTSRPPSAVSSSHAYRRSSNAAACSPLATADASPICRSSCRASRSGPDRTGRASGSATRLLRAAHLMQRMLDAGSRDPAGDRLRAPTRRHVRHRSPGGPGPADSSESERAQERSLLLPLFHQLTEEEQDQVVDALAAALEAAMADSGSPLAILVCARENAGHTEGGVARRDRTARTRPRHHSDRATDRRISRPTTPFSWSETTATSPGCTACFARSPLPLGRSSRFSTRNPCRRRRPRASLAGLL